MSKYLAVIENRIRRQRQVIGTCQGEIMKGRGLRANRELMAKAEAKIKKDRHIISINTKEVPR